MSAVDYLEEAELSAKRLAAAISGLRAQIEQGNAKTQLSSSKEVCRHARAIIESLKMLDFVVTDTAQKLKIVK